jgi:hypothetical protein
MKVTVFGADRLPAMIKWGPVVRLVRARRRTRSSYTPAALAVAPTGGATGALAARGSGSPSQTPNSAVDAEGLGARIRKRVTPLVLRRVPRPGVSVRGNANGREGSPP